jgi:hypothetical protein
MQQPMMQMQPQQPMMNQGMQFNRWAQPGFSYQTMPGFHQVDYSGGWNPNIHDQMLRNNINQVFVKHDTNRNGQLDPH